MFYDICRTKIYVGYDAKDGKEKWKYTVVKIFYSM